MPLCSSDTPDARSKSCVKCGGTFYFVTLNSGRVPDYCRPCGRERKRERDKAAWLRWKASPVPGDKKAGGNSRRGIEVHYTTEENPVPCLKCKTGTATYGRKTCDACRKKQLQQRDAARDRAFHERQEMIRLYGEPGNMWSLREPENTDDDAPVRERLTILDHRRTILEWQREA